MRRLAFAILGLIGLATASHACPNYQTHAAVYAASGPQLYAAHSFPVTAGGDWNVAYCGNVRPATDRGPGFFTAQPDFTFDLHQMAGYQLVLSVVSACDATLLVNTGSANWYYDDDDNGNLDPRIVLTRPSNGILDVWIGTVDGSYCNAQLTLETF